MQLGKTREGGTEQIIISDSLCFQSDIRLEPTTYIKHFAWSTSGEALSRADGYPTRTTLPYSILPQWMWFSTSPSRPIHTCMDVPAQFSSYGDLINELEIQNHFPSPILTHPIHTTNCRTSNSHNEAHTLFPTLFPSFLLRRRQFRWRWRWRWRWRGSRAELRA